MPVYQITFSKPEPDNTLLSKAIHQISPKAHKINETSFLVKSKAKPSEIRDILRVFTSEDNVIFVVEITKAAWAYTGRDTSLVRWQHLNNRRHYISQSRLIRNMTWISRPQG